MTQMQDHAFACIRRMLRPALRQGGDLASRAVCVDNLADKYHQLDPRIPRTARDAFKMNEAKVGKLSPRPSSRASVGSRCSTATSTATPTQQRGHVHGRAHRRAQRTGAVARGDGVLRPGHQAGEIRVARAFKWDGKDSPAATFLVRTPARREETVMARAIDTLCVHGGEPRDKAHDSLVNRSSSPPPTLRRHRRAAPLLPRRAQAHRGVRALRQSHPGRAEAKLARSTAASCPTSPPCSPRPA